MEPKRTFTEPNVSHRRTHFYQFGFNRWHSFDHPASATRHIPAEYLDAIAGHCDGDVIGHFAMRRGAVSSR